MKKLTWDKIVKRNNRAYFSKNNAGKRVMIAQDIINYIDSNHIEPQQGSYLRINDKDHNNIFYNNYDENSSFKKLLGEINTKCTVCAKGAIFLAAVARQNEVTTEEASSIKWSCVDSWDPKDNINNKLRLDKKIKNVFTAVQLNIIEECFEGPGIGISKNNIYYWFYHQYSSSEERMKVIMNNIIRNKGTFKPEQEKPKQEENV